MKIIKFYKLIQIEEEKPKYQEDEDDPIQKRLPFYMLDWIIINRVKHATMVEKVKNIKSE
jgi:hypothetical protein